MAPRSAAPALRLILFDVIVLRASIADGATVHGTPLRLVLPDRQALVPVLVPELVAGLAASCADVCVYASDGDCDDGGAGADYDACAPGTDCNDCGVRLLAAAPRVGQELRPTSLQPLLSPPSPLLSSLPPPHLLLPLRSPAPLPARPPPPLPPQSPPLLPPRPPPPLLPQPPPLLPTRSLAPLPPRSPPLSLPSPPPLPPRSPSPSSPPSPLVPATVWFILGPVMLFCCCFCTFTARTFDVMHMKKKKKRTRVAAQASDIGAHVAGDRTAAETPVAGDRPVAEAPVAGDRPVTAEAPAARGRPATAQASAAGERSVAAQAPAVADRPDAAQAHAVAADQVEAGWSWGHMTQAHRQSSTDKGFAELSVDRMQLTGFLGYAILTICLSFIFLGGFQQNYDLTRWVLLAYSVFVLVFLLCHFIWGTHGVAHVHEEPIEEKLSHTFTATSVYRDLKTPFLTALLTWLTQVALISFDLYAIYIREDQPDFSSKNTYVFYGFGCLVQAMLIANRGQSRIAADAMRNWLVLMITNRCTNDPSFLSDHCYVVSEGRAEVRIPVSKKFTHIRLVLDVSVNYGVAWMVYLSLPLLLANSTSYLNFVLNSVATTFIIELDNNIPGSTYKVVLPGGARSVVSDQQTPRTMDTSNEPSALDDTRLLVHDTIVPETMPGQHSRAGPSTYNPV